MAASLLAARRSWLLAAKIRGRSSVNEPHDPRSNTLTDPGILSMDLMNPEFYPKSFCWILLTLGLVQKEMLLNSGDPGPCSDFLVFL